MFFIFEDVVDVGAGKLGGFARTITIITIIVKVILIDQYYYHIVTITIYYWNVPNSSGYHPSPGCSWPPPAAGRRLYMSGILDRPGRKTVRWDVSIKKSWFLPKTGIFNHQP